MIRSLSPLLVALAFVLASASLASAQSDAGPAVDTGAVCVDVSHEGQPGTDGEKLGRCWKQLGLGILVAGCKVHAGLPHDEVSMESPPEPCPPPLADPVMPEGPTPPLDTPPPRA